MFFIYFAFRGTPENQYTYIDAYEKGRFLTQAELSTRIGLPEEMANLAELCRSVPPVMVILIEAMCIIISPLPLAPPLF